VRLVSHIDLLTPLLSDPPHLAVLRDAQAWSTIKEHAARYGVAALVAYAVRPHVSGADRAWCDQVLVESWMRHDRMLRHLDYLLGVFAAEDIPVLCLKGPLLARRYHNPPFLRKASMDLDLAVMTKDLPRACDALAAVGYTLTTPIREALREYHHVELDHPSRPHLELHFRLSHRALGIPVEEMFDRAVASSIPGGREARVLGPADQLLHLILHLATSRFGTLFHLHEIRRVCRAEPAEVVVEAIRRAVRHHYGGVIRMMDAAFRSRWNESFIPAGAIVPKTWLNWRVTPKLYRAFEEFSLPGRRMSVTDRVRARWMDFQLTDRPTDALRAAIFFLETARYSVTRAAHWRAREIRFTQGRAGTGAH